LEGRQTKIAPERAIQKYGVLEFTMRGKGMEKLGIKVGKKGE